MWTTTGPSAPRASSSAPRSSATVLARMTRAPRLSAFAARSTGSASAGFGTHYRRSANGAVPVDAADGRALAQPADALPVDLAANAESLGARVIRAKTIAGLRAALDDARGADGPVVVHIESDRYAGVPGYESWWDVPVAEVSDEPSVRAARDAYERARRAQRAHLRTP